MTPSYVNKAPNTSKQQLQVYINLIHTNVYITDALTKRFLGTSLLFVTNTLLQTQTYLIRQTYRLLLYHRHNDKGKLLTYLLLQSWAFPECQSPRRRPLGLDGGGRE